MLPAAIEPTFAVLLHAFVMRHFPAFAPVPVVHAASHVAGELQVGVVVVDPVSVVPAAHVSHLYFVRPVSSAAVPTAVEQVLQIVPPVCVGSMTGVVSLPVAALHA